MRVLLLHNPSAGGGNLAEGDLVGAVRQAGHDATYRSTKKNKIDPAEAEAAELVVVAGGDGTVAKVVAALGASCRRIAILPLGTANNIARSLGIEGAPEAILRGLGGFRERRFDVGIAEGPWGRRVFLEAVGVGAFAEMIEAGKASDMDADQKTQFGRDAPPRFLADAAPRNWRVAVDGVPLPEPLLLVEILNVPVAGPGLRLVPENRPGDGLFDVVCLRPERREALRAWAEADRGAAPNAVDIVQGRRVTLEWAGGALRIDDHFPEPPEGAGEVVVSLDREPLRVLAPEDGTP